MAGGRRGSGSGPYLGEPWRRGGDRGRRRVVWTVGRSGYGVMAVETARVRGGLGGRGRR